MLRRQKDPKLESMRRMVWLVYAIALAYVVFGARLWSLLVGR
jgi:hypothetical protein